MRGRGRRRQSSTVDGVVPQGQGKGMLLHQRGMVWGEHKQNRRMRMEDRSNQLAPARLQ